MANEPSQASKDLLAECANDYANRSAADPFKAADVKTNQTTALLAAQRGAARLWSAPLVSRDGGE